MRDVFSMNIGSFVFFKRDLFYGNVSENRDLCVLQLLEVRMLSCILRCVPARGNLGESYVIHNIDNQKRVTRLNIK